MLGLSRVRLAILHALATAGGTLPTKQVITDVAASAMTVMRHLRELESAGYITGDPAHGEDRNGRAVTWHLNQDVLHADLRQLLEATTIRSVSPGSPHGGE